MSGRFTDPRAARRLRLQVATAIAVFLTSATCPYVWLIDHFGYDDILREPADVILARFAAGGTPLVAAWLCFAIGSLAFIPVAWSLRRLTAAHGAVDRGTSTLGIASAIVQAIGLLRWVLVVPALAATFVEAAGGSATRETVPLLFDALHRYGGMVVGEMIGQLLLAGWTAGMVMQLWRSRVVPRWLAGTGVASLPLWIIGQSELLHPVLPDLPSIEVVPLAFMAWELWLALLAVAMSVAAWRAPQATTSSSASRAARPSAVAPR